MPTVEARLNWKAKRQCRRFRVFGMRLLLSVVALALTALTGTHAGAARKTGDIIGEMHEYYIWRENEDLLEVARADELGLIELMAANPGVDPWVPGRNTHLLLPTMHILPQGPRKGIVINTAELRLYYYDAEDGYFSFPLGVGRDGYLTPVGSTKIVRKKEKPSWYLTPSEARDHPELPKVIPPGEDNPLGEYAMYLGWPSYLIHGTNTPWGIGRRTSRGCIRMYPEDIEWLFRMAPIGTPVTVVDQPVKLGWKDGDSIHRGAAVDDADRQDGRDQPLARPPGSHPSGRPSRPYPQDGWARRLRAAGLAGDRASPERAPGLSDPHYQAGRDGAASGIGCGSGPGRASRHCPANRADNDTRSERTTVNGS